MKSFLVVLIAFLTLFMGSSPSWASIKEADKLNQSITIEKNNFFNQESPFEIARRERGSDTSSNSSYGNAGLWWTSIIIIGLGQVIMGDLWRGLKFWGIAILGSILAFAILGNSYSGSILAGTLTSLISTIVYVWSIVDAYQMSQEIQEASNISKDKMANLEKQIAELEENLSKISIGNNGIAFKALAF